MKKRIAALCCAVLLSQAACNVIDSATINQQAALNYRQNMDKARAARVVDTTSATAKRVQAVFRRLVPFADAANQTGQPFQWEMTVIRSNELNAWAMPGGKMAVYTGIVEKLNLTDAEIAAIIGHEMTHALREHSKAQVGQQLLTGIGMQIGSSILAQNSNVDPQTLQTGGALLSEYGISKPFSRQHETEADIGGLMLMAAAGYNPQAAPVVWQKMEQAGSSGMPSFLSTHPSGADRIQVLQQHMPEAMALYQQSGGRAPAPMPAAQANPLPQGIPVAQPAAVAPQPSNWVPQNPGVGMPVEQWMQKPGKRRR